jgi:Swi5-dependent recombination DNA repair protein 1
LVQKWKVASRAVAEEVYASARDRVNKMGGVGAMREREREKGGSWGWEGEEKGDGGGQGEGDCEDGTGFGGEDGGERDGRDERGERDGRDERDEREEGGKAEEEEVRDEEGYTMDMMLKTLNIDLDVIGYDKTLQRWID